MTVADDYLVELGSADFDAWDHEHASQTLERGQALPDGAREAHLLSSASHPSVSFMINLRAHGLPGADLARDATTAASAAFARRTVCTCSSAGLEGRCAERNLRLLDRICSLLGEWPEPEWSETVRRRVEQLGDAAGGGGKGDSSCAKPEENEIPRRRRRSLTCSATRAITGFATPAH